MIVNQMYSWVASDLQGNEFPLVVQVDNHPPMLLSFPNEKLAMDNEPVARSLLDHLNGKGQIMLIKFESRRVVRTLVHEVKSEKM